MAAIHTIICSRMLKARVLEAIFLPPQWLHEFECKGPHSANAKDKLPKNEASTKSNLGQSESNKP